MGGGDRLGDRGVSVDGYEAVAQVAEMADGGVGGHDDGLGGDAGGGGGEVPVALVAAQGLERGVFAEADVLWQGVGEAADQGGGLQEVAFVGVEAGLVVRGADAVLEGGGVEALVRDP